MMRVAELFDKLGDGQVDYVDFIAALRPERKAPVGPVTDMEKIQDEIRHQAEQCTCAHQYPIQEIGQGKYRVKEIKD
jgi:hypothetical protein